MLKGFTGMRWAELVGLEKEFVRRGTIRVEWQLYELDTGEFLRCPPKDDSHRTSILRTGLIAWSPGTSRPPSLGRAPAMDARMSSAVIAPRTARLVRLDRSWWMWRVARVRRPELFRQC
ncbi:hypothetical protein BG844_21430 [Couchioplanes caeruleus subsp. caeruleus]|uniref:Uncharacterized protein n=1 Tax=Couchioplanes caeruleus subsp. caeruleus TaxID=56427 RepID=A0A1K0GMH9_9ACTN|nr:hypothetical protein BG844_21430 [Couchioplanes caeruleus subsp. caeruleus]